jgi:hypothetical protein
MRKITVVVAAVNATRFPILVFPKDFKEIEKKKVWENLKYKVTIRYDKSDKHTPFSYWFNNKQYANRIISGKAETAEGAIESIYYRLYGKTPTQEQEEITQNKNLLKMFKVAVKKVKSELSGFETLFSNYFKKLGLPSSYKFELLPDEEQLHLCFVPMKTVPVSYGTYKELLESAKGKKKEYPALKLYGVIDTYATCNTSFYTKYNPKNLYGDCTSDDMVKILQAIIKTMTKDLLALDSNKKQEETVKQVKFPETYKGLKVYNTLPTEEAVAKYAKRKGYTLGTLQLALVAQRSLRGTGYYWLVCYYEPTGGYGNKSVYFTAKSNGSVTDGYPEESFNKQEIVLLKNLK